MEEENNSTSTSKLKIIIVGAGISGLGAARWLLDNDINNLLDVVVIEGSNRHGGRINTNYDYELPIDLGLY